MRLFECCGATQACCSTDLDCCSGRCQQGTCVPCAGDADCAGGAYCIASKCVRPPGTACTQDSQRASESCGSAGRCDCAYYGGGLVRAPCAERSNTPAAPMSSAKREMDTASGSGTILSDVSTSFAIWTARAGDALVAHQACRLVGHSDARKSSALISDGGTP
jgi:hypothetical protein